MFPSFLPNGRDYLFLARDLEADHRFEIRVSSLESTESKSLISSRASALYAGSGHLLFVRESSLLAQSFQMDDLTLTGVAVPVIDQVAVNPLTFQTLISVSDNGRLGHPGSSLGSQLVWFSREGERLNEVSSPGESNAFCLSAEGEIIF